MRQESINVFTFNELSPQAQENAREWYRGCMDSADWNAREWHESLESFVSQFNGTIRDYSYGEEAHRSYVKVNWRLDDEILEMHGVRLWKWLDVRLSQVVYPKSKEHRKQLSGHEFILGMAEGACYSSGVFTDCPPYDPLAKFIKRPTQGTTLQELLDDCIESFIHAVATEIEYRYSDACIDESILANGYKFTEDGELF